MNRASVKRYLTHPENSLRIIDNRYKFSRPKVDHAEIKIVDDCVDAEFSERLDCEDFTQTENALFCSASEFVCTTFTSGPITYSLKHASRRSTYCITSVYRGQWNSTDFQVKINGDFQCAVWVDSNLFMSFEQDQKSVQYVFNFENEIFTEHAVSNTVIVFLSYGHGMLFGVDDHRDLFRFDSISKVWVYQRRLRRVPLLLLMERP